MSLKKKFVAGIKWNAILMIVTNVLHFITLAVLVRLLAPSDFGLRGMIMVVIGFSQTFADMGFSNAIIQRQKVHEMHLSSFFWLNVFIGIAIFICIILTTQFVAGYFKKPELSHYLTVAAFTFLITPFGQLFRTLLRKELKFKTLSKIEMIGETVYSFSAIGLACAHFGVFSLIFGQLLRSLATVLLLFAAFWRIWWPTFHFNLREVRSYFRFGAFQMGRRIMNYLSANIDYIIIGRFLGAEALGFYTLAYHLVTFPLMKINPMITQVAFPTFSKIQHDHAKMRKGYCQIIQYVSLVSFPMLIGLMIIAPEFIRLVYSSKWTPSIIIVQILCIVGIFKSLGNPIGTIILATGKVEIGFCWDIFTAIAVSFALFIGVNWGIVGVAVALLILQLPFFCIIQPIVNSLIRLTFRQYFQAIRVPLICSILMFSGLIPFKMLVRTMNTFQVLFMTMTLGVILYTGSYYIHDKTIFGELRSMLKGG